jgi:polyhydroxybutyrate depolymerase
MESYTGFSGLADRYGFIAAYPNSFGTYWNSNGVRTLPDDVRYLGRLITYLKQRLCVDPDRVFLAGVSNGGGMAALAACRLSTEVSAFASVAGGYDGQPPCRPQRPESVLEIHGTADPVVPYFGQTRRRTADGLPPFVNDWVARDRCRGRPAVRAFARYATEFSWGRCVAAVRVEHIRIAGGRHQWPGADPPDPGPPSTFCGACAVWSFLAAVPVQERSWGRR